MIPPKQYVRRKRKWDLEGPSTDRVASSVTSAQAAAAAAAAAAGKFMIVVFGFV
jgi:hypothetical protein